VKVAVVVASGTIVGDVNKVSTNSLSSSLRLRTSLLSMSLLSIFHMNTISSYLPSISPFQSFSFTLFLPSFPSDPSISSQLLPFPPPPPPRSPSHRPSLPVVGGRP